MIRNYGVNRAIFFLFLKNLKCSRCVCVCLWNMIIIIEWTNRQTTVELEQWKKSVVIWDKKKWHMKQWFNDLNFFPSHTHTERIFLVGLLVSGYWNKLCNFFKCNKISANKNTKTKQTYNGYIKVFLCAFFNNMVIKKNFSSFFYFRNKTLNILNWM